MPNDTISENRDLALEVLSSRDKVKETANAEPCHLLSISISSEVQMRRDFRHFLDPKKHGAIINSI